LAGDPADFDIRELGTLTLPMPLTLVIGYADNCGRFRDAQTLMEHVVRCFHPRPTTACLPRNGRREILNGTPSGTQSL
jgi:hypothetical protein